MIKSDSALHQLVREIVVGDAEEVARLLASSPHLARAGFQNGATRQAAEPFFLERIGRYIYADDTALHIAAAAYETKIVNDLLAAGADVRARNRRGQEPLHAASCGSRDSPVWNPSEQTATIKLLVEAGADPNVLDKSGVSPLHKAIRTRCAAAVRTLIELGADSAAPNKNGSTPMQLATQNTGRGGTGSPAAKLQQQEILHLLRERHIRIP